MIFGIGTDIIEIGRVSKACEKPGFLQKYFTQREREYFAEKNFRSETIAGIFAGKEAVAKALGTGFSGFSAADIEIDRNESFSPFVVLKNGALKVAKEKNIGQVFLSISHCKEYAIAYAIMEVDENESCNSSSNENP